MTGMPSTSTGLTMSTTDAPIAVYAQTSQAGQPYIEAQITGQAAIDLARAITGRLAGQGIVGPRVTETLVALVAGAITDHPITLATEQADDLTDNLLDAVRVAWETGTPVGGVA